MSADRPRSRCPKAAFSFVIKVSGYNGQPDDPNIRKYLNEPPIMNPVMNAPATRAHTHVGPACRSVIPDPTASKSAVMFKVFATIKTAINTPRRMRRRPANFVAASSPRFLPVASAVLARLSRGPRSPRAPGARRQWRTAHVDGWLLRQEWLVAAKFVATRF